MQTISYARHRFPPDVIRHAVWLYLRVSLSYRDVEDLAERGLEISNETIRRWLLTGRLSRETSGAGDRYRMISGISMRWWSQSQVSACTCGGRSTVTAKCSMC
jgi:hypothetical protein